MRDGPVRDGLMRDGLVAAALCVGSLLAVATLIGRVAPTPYVECISDKLELLTRGRGTIDTIFIGSSRVHHDYAPAVFDETMAEAGLRTRSLNLGAPGMRLLESLYLLRRVAGEGQRLQYVLVELDEFFTPSLTPNRGKPREVYWHDLAHTVLAIRSVHRASVEEHGRRAGIAGAFVDLGHDLQHVRALGQRLLNVGLVSQLLAPPEAVDIAASCTGPANDGWVPLPDKPGDAARQEATRRGLEASLRQLASARRTSEPPPVNDFEVEVLEAIVEAAERTGATAVFVMSPLPADRRGTLEAIRRNEIAPLYAFNDPERYPDLMSADLMYDATHLNTRGAAAFTHRLAEELAADLRERRESRWPTETSGGAVEGAERSASEAPAATTTVAVEAAAVTTTATVEETAVTTTATVEETVP